MKYFLIVFTSGALLFASCNDDDDNSNAISTQDQNFMIGASYSNWAEVDAGQIAASRGDKDSVQMFGTMMVTDHGAAESSLDSLASKYEVTIPSQPDAEHQAKATYLSSLSGYTFDTAYINAQVADHQATISLFEDEAQKGNNSDVKAYVSKNLPVIQMHLQEALAIQSQLE